MIPCKNATILYNGVKHTPLRTKTTSIPNPNACKKLAHFILVCPRRGLGSIEYYTSVTSRLAYVTTPWTIQMDIVF